MRGLVRDPVTYGRVGGVIGGLLWAALVGDVSLPVATLALALLAFSSVLWLRWQGRSAANVGFRGVPRSVAILDLAAAATWLVATSQGTGTIAYALVLAAGVEALFALGAAGIALTAAAYGAARVSGDVLRVASGLPFDTGRDLLEAFVVGLVLVVFGAVATTFGREERISARALDRARALEKVATEIGAQLDPDEVLLSIPRTARRIVEVDHAALIVRRGDEFHTMAGSGTAEALVGMRSATGSGLVGDVLRRRETVVVEDYQAHPSAVGAVRALGLRATMAVPIFVHGEMAAVLTVGRLAAGAPFDREDQVAVEGFAAHAALALTNARTLDQARRIGTVSRLATSEGTAEEIVHRIVEQAAAAFNTEFAHVSEIRGGRSYTLAVTEGAQPDAARSGGELGPVRGEVVRTRSLVVVPKHPRLGLYATMGAPALINGEVAAVLVVGTTDPHRSFDLIDRQGMAAFGDATAATLRAVASRRERERRIRRLARLNELATELARVPAPGDIARLAYDAAGDLVACDAFYVACYDGERDRLEFLLRAKSGAAAGQADVPDSDDSPPSSLGNGRARHVITTGALYVSRAAGDPLRLRNGPFGSGARVTESGVHVPLKTAGRVVGVLSAQSYTPDAYDAEDVAMLESLGNLVAGALENVEHLSRARDLYLAPVKALAAAVDARDPYTRSHSARVAAISRLIAEQMELPPDEIRRVQLGALLHDIGKIGIPDAILNKPGPLTDEEWVIMRTHSAIGASIVGAVEPLRDLVPIVRGHHERHDGAGYPEGLAREEVSPAAYIVAAADAYEVIVSKRAYKPARSVEFAVSELRRCRGTQFHPAVVDALIHVIESDRAEGTARLSRVGSIEHEDIDDLASPGEALGRYASRSNTHGSQLAILQRLASEMTLVVDLDELAGRLLRIVCGAMGHSNGFLMTVEESGRLVVSAAVGPWVDSVDLPAGEGISAWVLEHGRLQNVPDVHADSRYVGAPEIRSSLIVPLRSGAEGVGVLGIESTRRAAFGADDEELLTAVSHQIAAAVRIARQHRAAKAAAATDPLTGLRNRRVFFDQLEGALARRDGDLTLSIAIIDVNLLKSVNDRWGHGAGDEALVRIGEILAAGVRADDTVTRIGGDEFGIVFARAPILEAERIMRRLAKQIARSTLSGGRALPSIAWGVASAHGDPTTADALVAAADRAMHRQKARGRVRTSA